jgi:hypothetical protein
VVSEDEPEATPEPEPITEPAEGPVLHYRPESGQFISGIPARDITPEDGLTDEQIELAISSGTYERP